MNKKYISPKCELLAIAREDILQTSAEQKLFEYNSDNQLDQAAFDLW